MGSNSCLHSGRIPLFLTALLVPFMNIETAVHIFWWCLTELILRPVVYFRYNHMFKLTVWNTCVCNITLCNLCETIYIFIYYISTINTQHMQRPDVLLQLGYTWRHVSAVKRPSSGQLRIMLLRYSQNCCPMGSHCLMDNNFDCTLTILF